MKNYSPVTNTHAESRMAKLIDAILPEDAMT